MGTWEWNQRCNWPERQEKLDGTTMALREHRGDQLGGRRGLGVAIVSYSNHSTSLVGRIGNSALRGFEVPPDLRMGSGGGTEIEICHPRAPARRISDTRRRGRIGAAGWNPQKLNQ